MDTLNTHRAERIFLELTELEPHARRAHLDRACGNDHALHEEVRSLLDAFERSAGYFERLPKRLGIADLLSASHAQTSHDDRTGARGEIYGSYTLASLLGRGGSGAVWRAVRNDGRFEGDVAVKLLAASSTRGRFQLEGAYLAKLTHSNIARLIDAGVDEADRPYLVLEFVEGSAIDRYCDERALTIAQRIRLFLQVLDAVAHAHARLIVHRDIKPSNVQVTDEGAVKLLDFGIAKLLADDAQPGSDATRQFGIALTPQFAAPEQLEGGAITTATDIYSLGLLLWLLLTGKTPRENADAESLAQLRAIAHREPARLLDTITSERSVDELAQLAKSRSTSLPELTKALRGDLDSIVRKAVAVEPPDRYATVADFAQDLRRFLNHEPVIAQPQTVTYRFRKFVRRHRGGVLTASLALFAILLTASLAVWQSIEARQQRDAALYQQQRAQASNEFLQVLLSEIGPEGEPLTLVELLERGVRMLDLQFGADEPFTARVLYDISLMYATLGRVDEQLALLDRASGLAAKLADDDLLGLTLCARARAELPRDAANARSSLERGRETLQRVSRPSSDALQECYRAEAQLADAAGDRDGAITAITAALAVVDADPIPSGAARAVLLNDLSEQHLKAGRFTDALNTNAELIDTLDRSGRGDTMPKVIYLLNRGAILNRGGEVRAAAEAQREALARIETMAALGEAPIGAHGHLANSLFRLAQYDEALALFGAGRTHAQAQNSVRWTAQYDLMMGYTLVRMGRETDAEIHLQAAEQIYDRTPDANQRLLSLLGLARAEAAISRGDTEHARAIVASVLEHLGYPERKAAGGLWNALAAATEIELAAGNWARVEQFATEALHAATAVAREPALSADVGYALLLRAKARQALNDSEGSRADLAAALTALTNGFGENHPSTREAQSLLR